MTVFENANAMPAPTWHRLRMNDAELCLPDDLAQAADAILNIPADAIGAPGDFEEALAQMQAAWEAEHPAPTAEEAAARHAAYEAEADATYGGTAQSTYQAGADALEESRSLKQALVGGLGKEAATWIRATDSTPTCIHARKGAEVSAQAIVTVSAGAASAAAIDIVADAESTVKLSVICAGDGDDAAIAATAIRVIAAAGARVDIVRTQAIAGDATDLDDTALTLDEGAQASVRQIVLGSAASFTGLGCDLRGDEARIQVDTRYLADGAQKRDFNYIIRHHGRKTKSELDANGVLAGAADKVLRGTIDLIRGSKGSEGQESETVLIVGDNVRNRTVPVILCNEDDVAGNHGATIGHIRPEQMFYLAARGYTPEAAERMFAQAIVEYALLNAPDDAARAAVESWSASR